MLNFYHNLKEICRLILEFFPRLVKINLVLASSPHLIEMSTFFDILSPTCRNIPTSFEVLSPTCKKFSHSFIMLCSTSVLYKCMGLIHKSIHTYIWADCHSLFVYVFKRYIDF